METKHRIEAGIVLVAYEDIILWKKVYHNQPLIKPRLDYSENTNCTETKRTAQ